MLTTHHKIREFDKSITKTNLVIPSKVSKLSHNSVNNFSISNPKIEDLFISSFI